MDYNHNNNPQKHKMVSVRKTTMIFRSSSHQSEEMIVIFTKPRKSFKQDLQRGRNTFFWLVTQSFERRDYVTLTKRKAKFK